MGLREPLIVLVLAASLLGLFEERLGLRAFVAVLAGQDDASQSDVQSISDTGRELEQEESSILVTSDTTNANDTSTNQTAEIQEITAEKFENIPATNRFLPSPTRSAPSHFRIVHLYNAYRVSNNYCEDPFCPYDQAQSVAMASMKRAQAKALDQDPGLSVALTAVTFPDELDIVPDGFIALNPLTRSTASQYPNMTINGKTRRLPFWQDMLESLLAKGDSDPELKGDLIVYTNSDIILHEDFYSRFYHLHEKYRRECYTINRQTISKENVTSGDLYTANDLDHIFALPNKERKEHPGHDCFIFTTEVAQTLNLEDVFVGYPPIGMAILAQFIHYSNKHYFPSFEDVQRNASLQTTSYRQKLEAQTPNKYAYQERHQALQQEAPTKPYAYQRFMSHETRLTFHLGCDNVWKGDAEHDAFTTLNEQNGAAIKHAPWNDIAWARPKRKRHRRDGNSTNTNSTRPPRHQRKQKTC